MRNDRRLGKQAAESRRFASKMLCPYHAGVAEWSGYADHPLGLRLTVVHRAIPLGVVHTSA